MKNGNHNYSTVNVSEYNTITDGIGCQDELDSVNVCA